MSRTAIDEITKPEQLNAAIARAFSAGDLDAFVALHTPDATVVPPPEGRTVHGLEAIRAATAPIFAMKPTMTSTVIKVVEGDGLALTHARWTLSATAPDGRPLELSGRGTIVSRRQRDGTWRIVIDDPLTPV
jgi:uncharacterized protein (TIGR02246 family)